ncbi:MAG: HEAT repeat domain-containing protein [Bdellovibrionota bacterium]
MLGFALPACTPPPLRPKAANPFADPQNLSVERLAELVEDKDPEIRAQAAYHLRGQGSDPAAAVLLIGGLQDSHAEVRAAAASSIEALGDGTHLKSAAPALVKALSDSSPKVRSMAALALGKIQSPEGPAALVLLLKDQDRMARWAASVALGKSGAAGVPELSRALWDKDPLVRLGALQALSFMGKDAVAAVPSLAQKLSDEDPSVRAAACGALASVGEGAAEAALPALGKLAGDGEPSVRLAAVRSLPRLAHAGFTAEAVALLKRFLSDKSPEVRAAAQEGLGSLPSR